MIKTIRTYYASQLEEYLMRWHHQPEGLATVGFIGNGSDERQYAESLSVLSDTLKFIQSHHVSK